MNLATILSRSASTTGGAATTGALGGLVLFASLFCLFLLPAVINGFPLVMDDSIAYSGEGAHWMRPKTAAVAAGTLYPYLGYWSLPLLNALLVASAWTAFARTFELGRAACLVLPLSLLALTPLYTSAVLVDVWFLAAVLLSAVAMKRSSFVLAVGAGVLLSSHGSGAPLVVVLGLCAAIAFRWPRYLAITLAAAATAITVNAALDARYNAGAPRLEKTFLSARLFSADPDLLQRECERSAQEVLCEAAALVAELNDDPKQQGRRDFHWDIARRLSPAFDIAAFEEKHATPIILDAVTSKPLEVAGLMAGDFLSFYAPETRLDFLPRLTEPMPDAFASSQQAHGTMKSPVVEGAATVLRYSLYLVVLGVLVFNRKRIGPEAGRWIAVLFVLCLANDAVFAILSGPPDRYHHRTLGLLAAIALLAMRERSRSLPEK